ncbi:hypothetical protein AAG570_006052 [Ranatra chinensis]|uniref:Uncharacterized protein n=1 Tax=Ranatra chinensis TaxID=642074 RepID=A0ABD0XWX1_9HEMI
MASKRRDMFQKNKTQETTVQFATLFTIPICRKIPKPSTTTSSTTVTTEAVVYTPPKVADPIPDKGGNQIDTPSRPQDGGKEATDDLHHDDLEHHQEIDHNQIAGPLPPEVRDHNVRPGSRSKIQENRYETSIDRSRLAAPAGGSRLESTSLVVGLTLLTWGAYQ